MVKTKKQPLTSVNQMTLSKKQICLFALLIPILLTAPSALQADFNKHEIKIINEQIEGSFKLLVDTWNEELYFEMYDLGQRKSQKRLSRGEFAQRMVDLRWKPTLKPIKIDKIDILYMNYAVIYFWQEFENKVNVMQKVDKYMVFPAILEGERWKFDLTQLIRIPYEGTFKEQPKEKPKEEVKEKPETEKETGETIEGNTEP